MRNVIVIAVLCGLMFANTVSVLAQSSGLTPYSRFGFGDVAGTLSAQSRGMGGLSVGLIGRQYVHRNNPASYIYVDSLSAQFNFDLSMKFAGLKVQNESGTFRNPANHVSVGSITMAFPIVKGLRIAAGLLPQTNMDYKVRSKQNGGPQIGQYYLDYEGSGGLNELYIGLGFGTTRLSGGVNATYNFGYNENRTYLMYSDTLLESPSSTLQNRIQRSSGFGVDFGLQYRQPLSDHYQMALGVTYRLPTRITTHNTVDVVSLGAAGSDTVFMSEASKGSATLPSTASIGLSLLKDNLWTIGAEYRRQNYKAFDLNESSVSGVSLENAWTVMLGGEVFGRNTAESYLGVMSYRAGVYYGKDQLAISGKQLEVLGVSVGFSLPIRRSLSRIDIALEYGHRGQAKHMQIQEDFFRIVVGVKAIEYWFMKRKFD